MHNALNYHNLLTYRALWEVLGVRCKTLAEIAWGKCLGCTKIKGFKAFATNVYGEVNAMLGKQNPQTGFLDLETWFVGPIVDSGSI